ncbi:hypothetical protein [Desulfobulbus elongatus]|uniref:hypothetical protein n=1 Tax=Desulfobulbus elongatus TaxID=53332 RepID=UPI0012F89C4D|nr:hypothetical protein [Desulfobulbus elongatus]
MSGVFISRGMTVTIPEGGLTISLGSDGNLASSLTIHVRFDVCPTWCKLAIHHLADAEACRLDRVAAWDKTNEDQKGVSLEREFEASMQAIMAAAIALDAFYSMIQGHVQLPPTLIQKWRTKRTSRYSQVTEVLRRGFHLKPNGTANLRQNLKEIYRLRDMAVHPSGKIKAPLLHPEIQVGVEWRFAYFRAQNAEKVVNATTGMLWDLAHNGKPTDSKIMEYMNTLRPRLVELYPDGHPSVQQAAPPPT